MRFFELFSTPLGRNVLLLMASLAAATGCGGGTDTPSDIDAGPIDMPPQILPEPLAYNLDGTPATLDLSCLGVWTTPARTGAAVSFVLEARDYQGHQLLPNMPIQYYPDNIIPSDRSCTGSCVMGTSDSMGRLTVDGIEGAWFGYFVPQRDCGATCPDMVRPAPTVHYDNKTPANGGMHNANTVSLATLNLIPTALGVSRQPGTALFSGQFFDCAEHVLANIQVRAYLPDGTYIAAPSGTRTAPAYRYFDGNSVPDATKTYSQADGLFGGLNLPVPASGSLRFEGWGTLEGVPRMIHCEEYDVIADGVATASLRPKHADAPSNCSE